MTCTRSKFISHSTYKNISWQVWMRQLPQRVCENRAFSGYSKVKVIQCIACSLPEVMGPFFTSCDDHTLTFPFPSVWKLGSWRSVFFQKLCCRIPDMCDETQSVWIKCQLDQACLAPFKPKSSVHTASQPLKWGTCYTVGLSSPHWSLILSYRPQPILFTSTSTKSMSCMRQLDCRKVLGVLIQMHIVVYTCMYSFHSHCPD